MLRRNILWVVPALAAVFIWVGCQDDGSGGKGSDCVGAECDSSGSNNCTGAECDSSGGGNDGGDNGGECKKGVDCPTDPIKCLTSNDECSELTRYYCEEVKFGTVVAACPGDDDDCTPGVDCPDDNPDPPPLDLDIDRSGADTTLTVDGENIDMVFVIGGVMTVGCNAVDGYCTPSEHATPKHDVGLSSFYIGKYEVTQRLWTAVMGSNPLEEYAESWGASIGEDKPVGIVSWNDAQEFIAKLNQKTGKTFRLPTDAEWEYAARGGVKSENYQKYSGGDVLSEVGWCGPGNGAGALQPVGGKAPNELGIYDMTGNAGEMVSDWHADYPKTGNNEVRVNPTGPESGTERVCRGGNYTNTYNETAASCRVYSRRAKAKLDSGTPAVGFRLAMTK